MEHIAGTINPSDDLTKALGWILHARHARHSMGHYRIGSLIESSAASQPLVPSARVEGAEAGEGVGARSDTP
jgi:hypothetical protein